MSMLFLQKRCVRWQKKNRAPRGFFLYPGSCLASTYGFYENRSLRRRDQTRFIGNTKRNDESSFCAVHMRGHRIACSDG